MRNFIFILLIVILFMCGAYPCQANEIYQVDTDYTIYIPTTDDYQVSSMPPNTFYPDLIYSHTVHSNITCGNATYQFGQEISSGHDGIYTNIYETKISGGNNAGQIVGYTEEFKFMSDSADTWESRFYFESKRACSGTVTLYAYKNNTWVQIESQSFNTYINYDDIVPDSAINGWKYVVHCTLNTNFTFLRYDDMYADGYTLNQFSWIVRSSQQQAEDTQDKIEENTRQANGLLGTIQSKIENIKSAIDDVITGITNLPTTILNGLKDLFIPDDFTSLLTDNISDLTDSLGFLGFPLAFINDLITTIIDADSLDLAVSVPSIGSPWGTLFPGYTRSNILYWVNYRCFSNLGNSSMFSSILSILGLSYNSSIISCIHAFTNIALFLALLRLAVNKYNDIFGTDLDSGGDDD